MRNFVRQYFTSLEAINPVQIKVKIVKETPRAVQIEYWDKRIWLRKSDIEIDGTSLAIPQGLWERKIRE